MINIEIVKKAYTLAKALLCGESVGPERLAKRLDICASCDLVRIDQNGMMRCGICGCALRGDNALINLARYEETPDYCCKHPTGSRWKKGGC